MMLNAVRGWMRGRAVRILSGDASTFPARLKSAVAELPEWITSALTAMDDVTKQIVLLERQMTKAAKNDDRCRRLMTAPGIGPITAIGFVSTLDTTTRFESAHLVESYLGLTPGEYASSDKHRRTGITKAGSSRMRWLLIQAAHSARRCRPKDPMVLWSKKVEERRGKKVAIVALARKLAGILFALWRDEKNYSPLVNAPPAEANAA